VHPVAAGERGELGRCHRRGVGAFRHADVAEHVLETRRRNDPNELESSAAGILDAVPDSAGHEDRRARRRRHPAVLEDRGRPAGMDEQDFVLVLVEMHGDHPTGAEALMAHRHPRRSGGLRIDLDRDSAAARRGTQAQRFTVRPTTHDPRRLHRSPSSRPRAG